MQSILSWMLHVYMACRMCLYVFNTVMTLAIMNPGGQAVRTEHMPPHPLTSVSPAHASTFLVRHCPTPHRHHQLSSSTTCYTPNTTTVVHMSFLYERTRATMDDTRRCPTRCPQGVSCWRRRRSRTASKMRF